jgi:hypothetical protein
VSHVFLRPGALLLACASLLACGHDEAFLSLQDLCPERASDICSAQNNGCPCPPSDPASCEDAGVAACMAEQDALTAESTRSYDSTAAWRQGEATRAVVNSCGAPPALSTYFKGGLPLGSACERASQCASGACSGQPPTCSELASGPLCPQ